MLCFSFVILDRDILGLQPPALVFELNLGKWLEVHRRVLGAPLDANIVNIGHEHLQFRDLDGAAELEKDLLRVEPRPM